MLLDSIPRPAKGVVSLPEISLTARAFGFGLHEESRETNRKTNQVL